MRPETGTATLTPVSQTFGRLEPHEFRTNIESLWKSAREITDTVVKQVESEQISPLQGAAITAHVTGTLFGVSEFSRELTPADLALMAQSYGNGG